MEVTSSLGREEIVAPTLEVPPMRSYTAGSLVFAGVFLLLLAGQATFGGTCAGSSGGAGQWGRHPKGPSSDAGLDTFGP